MRVCARGRVRVRVRVRSLGCGVREVARGVGLEVWRGVWGWRGGEGRGVRGVERGVGLERWRGGEGRACRAREGDRLGVADLVRG